MRSGVVDRLGVVGIVMGSWLLSGCGHADEAGSAAIDECSGGLGNAVRGFERCGLTAEQPLLFVTGNYSKGSFSLRADRTDGATALLGRATTQGDFDVGPYIGAPDRRGSFPSMSPHWRNFSVSPDGSWVLWTREDESWDVIDTRDGSIVSLPNTSFGNKLVEWAPDGKSFFAIEIADCSLEVVTPATSRAVSIASLDEHCRDQDYSAHAWWTSDGSRVAYIEYLPVSGITTFRVGELHTVKPDGTDPHTIDSHAETCLRGTLEDQILAMPWSLDGNRIAYATLATDPGGASGSTVQIRTAAADGTDSSLLLELPLSDFGDGLLIGPFCEWSPNGDRMLIRSEQGISSVDAHGGELHTLSDPAAYYDFSWSPDGSRVTVIEQVDETRVLEVMNYDGTERRRVSTTTLPDSIDREWLWSADGRHGLHGIGGSSGGLELHVYDAASENDVILPGATDRYGWTPDGSRVLYETASSSDATVRIVTVLPDGSDEIALSVPQASLPELVWLAGGKYWAGADQDGVWIEKFPTSDRHAVKAKSAAEDFMDFAPWDHTPVWR